MNKNITVSVSCKCYCSHIKKEREIQDKLIVQNRELKQKVKELEK
jgi:hypothetical protein